MAEIMPNKPTAEQLMDDANIIGGSPTDRVIGMLLERVEAVREVNDDLRDELRKLIDTHTDIKNTMGRIIERQDQHEKNDREAFAAVNNSTASIGGKIDSLSQQITAANTTSLIQKAQFNAGWKVIVYLGAIALGLFGIFTTFFNHNWK